MHLDEAAFQDLMHRLAHAWQRLDADAALDCFTSDAVYMEPPDIQLYRGSEQLRPYFEALTPGTFMTFHALWFDEARQTGAGEYSFGSVGMLEADHGVAVVELRDGRIASWHEYQRKGPSDFARFVAPDGKSWQWHIGNYP